MIKSFSTQFTNRFPWLISALNRLEPVGVLLIRLVLGFIFLRAGWGKLHNLENATQYFESLHLPAPAFQAPFVATVEFVGGLFLMLGLFTRLAAFLLMMTMVVALIVAVVPEVKASADIITSIEAVYFVCFYFSWDTDPVVTEWIAMSNEIIRSAKAPEPVGAYPHARKVGDLLFLSGVGPRKAGSVDIPGVHLDATGNVLSYDIAVQTESVIENIRIILEAAGSSFEKIVDVQVFLTNMKKDFKVYNEVYAKHFTIIQATRTTIEVGALPTPIHVEFKVIATV